jgi:oligoendopeptidase F
MDAQPAPLFGTSYPVEIPSITNELILLRELADTATLDTQKLLYLDQYLDTIATNYWRATMYADFEKQMYAKAWNDEPITTDLMDQTFASLFKQYYGSAMTYDDYLGIEWGIKPHFYSVYYPHVYAISLAAANKIATEIHNQTP